LPGGASAVKFFHLSIRFGLFPALKKTPQARAKREAQTHKSARLQEQNPGVILGIPSVALAGVVFLLANMYIF